MMHVQYVCVCVCVCPRVSIYVCIDECVFVCSMCLYKSVSACVCMHTSRWKPSKRVLTHALEVIITKGLSTLAKEKASSKNSL